MSNNKTNNDNAGNNKKSATNKAVTGVEVVKDDTVVYEKGNFKDYNAQNDYEASKNSDSEDDTKDKSSENSDKKDSERNSKQDDSKQDDSKQDDSKQDDSKQDDSKQGDSKQDNSKQDEKSGLTMASIYQWASKLKDEFTSEAADITHEVTEKAAAMTLGKLLNAVEFELTAFDKSIEAAKNLIENAEEERKKIASKKDKYQDMIDKLDQE